MEKDDFLPCLTTCLRNIQLSLEAIKYDYSKQKQKCSMQTRKKSVQCVGRGHQIIKIKYGGKGEFIKCLRQASHQVCTMLLRFHEQGGKNLSWNKVPPGPAAKYNKQWRQQWENHSSTTGYVQNVQGMIPKKLYGTRKSTGSKTIYLARWCSNVSLDRNWRRTIIIKDTRNCLTPAFPQDKEITYSSLFLHFIHTGSS